MSNNGQLLPRNRARHTCLDVLRDNRDTRVWMCFATNDKLAKAILATSPSGQTVPTSSLDAMQGDECHYVNELSMRSLVTTSACVKVQPNFGARHDINKQCRMSLGVRSNSGSCAGTDACTHCRKQREFSPLALVLHSWCTTSGTVWRPLPRWYILSAAS